MHAEPAPNLAEHDCDHRDQGHEGEARHDQSQQLFSSYREWQTTYWRPLLINREGRTFELRVKSSDRRRFLKGPVLH